MKKIYLSKVQQYNQVSYIGSVDPRKLVRLADQDIITKTVNMPEDQRPLVVKHTQDIAKHVGNGGLLPTSIIVGTKDRNKLTVEEEKSVDGYTLYYMMFPETEDELLQYANSIDISDGQHRVFSFIDQYRSTSLKDVDIYEVSVLFYLLPSTETRRMIFYTANDKQMPVSPNLLFWLKDKMGLLDKDEQLFLPLLRRLNTENGSPLKGRIIMGAEKITGGYKATQLKKILKKVNIYDEISTLTSCHFNDSQMADNLSEYLLGWEKKYHLSFCNPPKKNDTMTKISGLRYILFLFPVFVDLAVMQRTRCNSGYVVNLISELELAKKCRHSKRGNSVFCKCNKLSRGKCYNKAGRRRWPDAKKAH